MALEINGGPRSPRLPDRVREANRLRHGSRSTEKSCIAWIRRYILFHGKRHPAGMGAPEVAQFLSSLAVEGKVAVWGTSVGMAGGSLADLNSEPAAE